MPNSWVEFADDGFSVFEKRFLSSPRVRRAQWTEVQAIRAFLWDAYSGHVSGFRFTSKGDHSVCVDDTVAGWPLFREQVFARFPAIDKTVIENVERAFPGEAESCCWRCSSLIEEESNFEDSAAPQRAAGPRLNKP